MRRSRPRGENRRLLTCGGHIDRRTKLDERALSKCLRLLPRPINLALTVSYSHRPCKDSLVPRGSFFGVCQELRRPDELLRRRLLLYSAAKLRAGRQKAPIEQPDNCSDRCYVSVPKPWVVPPNMAVEELHLREKRYCGTGHEMAATCGQLDNDNVTDVFMRTATKVWKYPHSHEDRKALLATWLVAIAMRDQGER